MSGCHRILVVDDVEQNRLLLKGLVQSLGYDVEMASDGLEALSKLPLHVVDLVLLDVMMPGLDGFEVVRKIREQPSFVDLPVILVTALDSRHDRVRGVESGASDFIAKPVDRTELLVRVSSQLKLKDAQDQIKRHTTELEERVAARTAELQMALAETSRAQLRIQEAHLDTIRRLVLSAGFRDGCTAAHIQRISLYTKILARTLGLDGGRVEVFRHASPLHDIGKIGIPDAILLKRGPLTAEERKIMDSHTLIGAEILAGSPSEVIQTGAEIALTHHERWDGRGYPRGLAGTEIPLSGRICAVVDVFDALTSDRPYRRSMGSQEALEIMRKGRGTHFDPDLFDVFEGSSEEVIRARAEQSEGTSGHLTSLAALRLNELARRPLPEEG